MRGGTSRGVYFLRDDLPRDPVERDRVLVAIMGGPDELRVDGLSGGHALTSKIAIVARSERADADVDYLFLQAIPGEGRISASQNCGNILSGVGPFAIQSGLVPIAGDHTTVRVYMINSESRADVTVETPDGAVNYSGDVALDGVPGTAAPVVVDFLDVAGASCGSLLPTGNVRDSIEDLEVTCIDNGMPVVVLRATDLGVTGFESPQVLDADSALKAQLESVRLAAGYAMGLGDVRDATVPKMCLVAPPAVGGSIATRMFIPHVCHRSIGVLGAVSAASACLIPGSVAHDIADVPDGDVKDVIVEHPSGAFPVRLQVDEDANPSGSITRAGVVRTARMIMRGEVFVPDGS